MPLPSGSLTQVAYVSNNVEKAVKHWLEVMNAGPFYMLRLPPIEKRYRGRLVTDTFVTAVGFAGNTQIEISQPTNNEPSIIREILELKGEGGVHHIFPEFRSLNDLEYRQRRQKYENAGLKVALEFDIPGMGYQLFYDALDSIGTFIELAQLSPAVFQTVHRIYDAHRSWDGKNPIRDIAEVLPR
jgi:Glyoxalase/Bleomycin resistance protein/Dioxygenase superfamily